ncbi:MAG: HesA/MoeB/ThiF family protein [Candidatus Hadarchaeum sp.]|uniref:HesA/MoeB/ThiF family protein n=1 Tax=Candidatus Hadarchaeum sp. TaxID=2883567 RepID=UPI003D0E064A
MEKTNRDSKQPGGRIFFGLTQDQLVRYSRQLILKEVGGKGQKKLMHSKVLIIGAGGLGSPAALYLAAAGVGRIGIVDSDKVDLSNLQRQIIHSKGFIGKPKAASAKNAILALNPEVEVVTFEQRLTPENALDIIGGWDFVVDGSDNFPTKFLVNDACVLKGVPFSHAGVLRFIGMTMTVLPRKGPCYRCLVKEAPPPGAVPTCQEAGVLGTVPGVMGTIQATEAIKFLLGVGSLLIGRVLYFDALSLRFDQFELKRNPKCPSCGDRPLIRDLSQVDYGTACRVRSDVQGEG